MKRIWVLTELYFPERTSTAYFLTAIAQGLAQQYAVGVITGNSMYEIRGEPLPQREHIAGVDVQRCRGTALNKNHLMGKLLNGITRSIAIFWQSLRQCHRQDLVLVVTNPPFLPIMALWLKYWKGCDYVLLVHDVYPEVLVASGMMTARSLLYRAVQAVNAIVYRQARHVITLGRDMSQLVETKLPASHTQSIQIIPNWAETDSVYPLPAASPLLEQLQLTEKFVVLYAGNMGRTHDLQILIDSAAWLLPQNPDVHFLCIGAGAKKTWLETQARDRGLTNLTVLAYLPHGEKNNVLNACNVGLISFMPGMAGVSVPSRMYNQMAAGKPMIAVADAASELAIVVQEEQIGWVVPPGDADGLVKVIQAAAADHHLCMVMGQKAALAVQQKYCLTHAHIAYQNLFGELFQSPSMVARKVPSHGT